MARLTQEGREIAYAIVTNGNKGQATAALGLSS
jgi:LmbE family N-acetylglucosaminyl deacetylase